MWGFDPLSGKVLTRVEIIVTSAPKVTGKKRRPVRGAPHWEISHDGRVRKHNEVVAPSLWSTTRLAQCLDEAEIRGLIALDRGLDDAEWIPLDCNSSWDEDECELLVVDLGDQYTGPLLSASGRGDTHRLLDEIVALEFHSKPPHPLYVMDVVHLDYNPLNCAAANLQWRVDEIAYEYANEIRHRGLMKPGNVGEKQMRTAPAPASAPEELDTRILVTNELPVRQPLKYLNGAAS
jgi:hypothetical protein